MMAAVIATADPPSASPILTVTFVPPANATFVLHTTPMTEAP